MLRGSLTTLRRRCGKPSCRCASGAPHESPALTFTEAGRTTTITLAASEIEEVAAALARYEQARARLDARGIEVPIVVDFVHVLEYLWAAAWCFFPEADPAAEHWVRDRALAVLDGDAKAVATGLRRRASAQHLPTSKPTKADEAAQYLTNKADHLNYPTTLKAGWPIATGVIEGACRHLVKDRMDITGARWSTQGAEAVLKLRAVRANHDFDQYWRYHLERERQRVHESRFLNSVIPAAA